MKKTVASLAALFCLALVSAVLVVVPSAMTAPFTYHTPDLIASVYTVRSWGTTAAIVLFAAGGLIFYRLWKQRTSAWAPAIGAMPMLLLAASVFFSRQHLVEWIMFAPPETIAYEAASGAAHVAESEYVMGVSVGDEARAYPILMVAYYHIVHDEIAGEPYVVTY